MKMDFIEEWHIEKRYVRESLCRIEHRENTFIKLTKRTRYDWWPKKPNCEICMLLYFSDPEKAYIE